MNKWMLFIAASALISAAAGFAQVGIVPGAVFGFITGIGTLCTVLVMAAKDFDE